MHMLYSNEKLISLISFYKFFFQSIAVIKDISPSSGSVKVILLILEISMVIRLFNQAQGKPLGRGGREKNDWNDQMNKTKKKVCGHLTTKCSSTASQVQLSMEAWGEFG